MPGVAPHSVEAERSVLGAILISERTLYAIVIDEGLRPEDFYLERHRLIFEVVVRMYHEGVAIDTLTLTEALADSGKLEAVGGAEYLDGLSGAVPSVSSVRQYAKIVRDRALTRRLLIVAFEIQEDVERGGDPHDLVERAERKVLDVAHVETGRDFLSAEQVMYEELPKMQDAKTAFAGTETGFLDFDRLVGGMRPGNLLILAARPSMGKSAMATNIAEHVAIDLGKRVALFSLEMSTPELAQRFVASQARVPGEKLRNGTVSPGDWPKILEAAQRIAKAPLFIDDSSAASLLEIRAKARRLHTRGGLDLIVVDYLQLMLPERSSDSRVEQVSQMSRGLKLLARELELPIIALSQLSRAVEQRHDRRPVLSDLRDSGGIEQDADLVAFIYRDDYYVRDSERPGEADVIVAKNRNGGVGDVVLTFRPEYPKFMSTMRVGPL